MRATFTTALVLSLMLAGAADAKPRASRARPAPKAAAKSAPAKPEAAARATVEFDQNPANINNCVTVKACGLKSVAGDRVAVFRTVSTEGPAAKAGRIAGYARVDSRGCFALTVMTGAYPTELRYDVFPASQVRDEKPAGKPLASSTLHVSLSEKRLCANDTQCRALRCDKS